MPPEGESNVECRSVDIQLYTWLGPGFESGECWYQGHRFINGATWGRIDIADAPYCVCEQGKVRIFYSQLKAEKPAVIAADSLTILGPVHGSSPSSNDLAHWPIPNIPTIQQRSVLCSSNRLGVRVRSRDGCVGCKCSKNGHWLCRKPPSTLLKKNRTTNARQRTNRPRTTTPRNHHYPYSDSSNSVNVRLHVRSSHVRPQCSNNTIPQYCVLIERISSSSSPSNISEKSSRYIEIPRETSWIDKNKCTQCSCTLNGRLTCEFLHDRCSRACLIHKSQPISIIYYFPSGSKWLTPPNDKCRSCICVNGQRTCINCDQTVKIDIAAAATALNNIQKRPAIGEYSLLPLKSQSAKTTPCLLQINTSSHRLILPGQKTWFKERCYICSKHSSRLLSC
ncbi:unnamed protein product [Adineta steineri]|uniref:Uncharacterized protein n=1 Tax=Adineta steineri TaxID=433720 RepID=A0A814HLC3_9BILA|nr:unnamed protein product [Adineta steineri]